MRRTLLQPTRQSEMLRTLNHILFEIGRSIDRSTPADGNGMFHSIISSGSLSIDHAVLRAGCMAIASDEDLLPAAQGEAENMTAGEYRCWMGTEVGLAWGGMTEAAMCARYLSRPITVVSPSFIRTLFPNGGEQQGWGPCDSIVIVNNGDDHYFGTVSVQCAQQSSELGNRDAKKGA